MEWQPRETAPKDGTTILVWEPNALPNVVAALWHLEPDDEEYEGWVYADETMSDIVPDGPEFTHWMPLPPPPGDA